MYTRKQAFGTILEAFGEVYALRSSDRDVLLAEFGNAHLRPSQGPQRLAFDQARLAAPRATWYGSLCRSALELRGSSGTLPSQLPRCVNERGGSQRVLAELMVDGPGRRLIGQIGSASLPTRRRIVKDTTWNCARVPGNLERLGLSSRQERCCFGVLQPISESRRSA